MPPQRSRRALTEALANAEPNPDNVRAGLADLPEIIGDGAVSGIYVVMSKDGKISYAWRGMCTHELGVRMLLAAAEHAAHTFGVDLDTELVRCFGVSPEQRGKML